MQLRTNCNGVTGNIQEKLSGVSEAVVEVSKRKITSLQKSRKPIGLVVAC